MPSSLLPSASHSPEAEFRHGSLRILSIRRRRELIFVLAKAPLIDHMTNHRPNDCPKQGKWWNRESRAKEVELLSRRAALQTSNAKDSLGDFNNVLHKEDTKSSRWKRENFKAKEWLGSN